MNEKEVDLRDYIKLILESKKLVLAMFLLGIIVAIVFNFISIPKEKVYKGKTLLEIGYENKVGGNKMALIEEPKQLIEKIKNGVYGKYSDGDIFVLNPAETNLIEIRIEGSEKEKIKSVLEGINEAIVSAHNEKLSVKKEILENEIINIQSRIDLLVQQEKNIKSEVASQQLIFFLLKNDLKVEEQQISDIKGKLAGVQLTSVVLSPMVSEKPFFKNHYLMWRQAD